MSHQQQPGDQDEHAQQQQLWVLQPPPQPQQQLQQEQPQQEQPQPQPQQQQPQPLMLRRASISSLDESSQKCDNNSQSGSGQGPPFSLKPVHRNTAHAPKCLEGLSDLRRSGLLTDVTLVAGDVEVSAHKNVLAACSPYFYAMFTGFSESTQERITLQEVDPAALRILIDYVYTSQVEVNEDNVQTLLTAANLLQLEDVRDACCEFLASQLHPTNCLGIKAFADLHGCVDLKSQAEAFTEAHFAEVLDCDEFLALTSTQVCELIQSDTITVPSEERVYESVISWVQRDLESRSQCLPELMEFVRLPLLNRDYLLQRVDGSGLFEKHPRCKDFVIEALKYHLSVSDPSVAANLLAAESTEAEAAASATFGSSLRTRPRQPIGLPKVMLAIGGQAPKAIRAVECYDFKEERWFQVSEMESRRCRCGVAVVRGHVYAVGGFNGSLRVRTVDEYDPIKDKWTSVANMEARRSTLGVAVLKDHIYAVGGFDGSSGLNSAEVLDLSLPTGTMGGTSALQSREWRPIASMSTRRSSVGVGVLGGLIYAVGGYDGNSRHCLSSVEVYNPEQDVWGSVADMSARRSGAGVGVLGGLLYAVGGHDGPLVRKSVECYNPESNEWKPIAEMNCCRRNAGVIAHSGLLFVVGGDDGSMNLQSVEVYNPNTDVWTVLAANMSIGRSYTGVCVIDKPETM